MDELSQIAFQQQKADFNNDLRTRDCLNAQLSIAIQAQFRQGKKAADLPAQVQIWLVRRNRRYIR